MLLAVGLLAVLCSARALGPQPRLRPVVSALTLRPPGLVSKHLFQGLSFANPSLRCFGFLVPVPSACTMDTPPFSDGRPFVPVLPASGCPVEEKIRSLVHNNASGIIVYGDNGYVGADLSQFKSHFESPCIIIIDRVSGELLMDKILENNTKVIVHISPDDPDTAAAKRLIWVVGILVGFGTLIFLIRILQNYIRLRTRVAQAPRVTKSFKDMQRQAIDEIPVRQIHSHEETKEQCSICLEGFLPGILVRTLRCRHEFHPDCIDEWLVRNRLCPLCKHPSYQLNLVKNPSLLKKSIHFV